MGRQLRGVFAYLVSPVERDGAIREGVLRRLVSDLIDAGIHGLTPLGSTGEVAYLTWEQRRRIVEIVVDEARGRVPVVAGVAAAATHDAVQQARAYESMGVDGIVPMLNAYFPLGPEEIIGYFEGVARSVSVSVVLYTNPRFQGFELTAPMVERLCRLPNVRYLKDASGNTGKLLTIRSRLGDRVGIFAASAHVPALVMRIGGVGWMAGPACLAPRQSVQLYELASSGRWEEAMALQQQLWRLNEAFQKYNLAACIKAGLELLGYDVGDPVPPQRPLNESERAEIAEVLKALQLL